MHVVKGGHASFHTMGVLRGIYEYLKLWEQDSYYVSRHTRKVRSDGGELGFGDLLSLKCGYKLRRK